MNAREILEHGRTILNPVLLPHGFVFEPGLAAVGSGGTFARGSYVRGSHRLEFSVREHLGEVVYRVGETTISHEDLMRVIAGPRSAKYPGFSDDPLDGFRGLKDDLERYGKAFLRTADEDFHAFAERAIATRPRSGFGRLFDEEAG